ncbi:MAG: hypothetical protein CM15mV34_0670 [Caudoviricetes sp.]|nr:MAG: hypothetical protein CM15mV34_0670 [Caudoviricetes sp.]
MALVALRCSKDTTTTYGFQNGNLGADNGGGTPNSITVYANASVAGFDKVNAWLVNKAWNQNSDPGVMHLFVLLVVLDGVEILLMVLQLLIML